MADPAAHLASTPTPAPSRGFPWYVAGVATWFGAFGMQQVLFSWLVVGELHAEARWVGVAQSASMIPTFLLILLGGALADRHDRRGLLIRLHLIAIVLALGLLAAVSGGALWLALIAYALHRQHERLRDARARRAALGGRGREPDARRHLRLCGPSDLRASRRTHRSISVAGRKWLEHGEAEPVGGSAA